MARLFLEHPVYQFPLAYPSGGSFLGICDVQIFAEPKNAPTVVMKERSDNEGASVSNSIETICSIISFAYLDSLGINPKTVRWLTCFEEDWSEVTFAGCEDGNYFGARFKFSDPVAFDWDSLMPEVAYKEHKRIVDPNTIHGDDFKFNPDECHRMHYHVCSLDDSAKPDDGYGESSYGYCRNLAGYALIWDYLVKTYGESALKMDVTSKLTAEIRKHVNEKYGVANQRAVEEAIRLFGANRNSGIRGVRQENGTIILDDGRHRSCIAKRLGIHVGATVLENV